MSEPKDFQPCIFCGGDPSEPDHYLHCDGRQGGRDEEESVPTPELNLSRGKRKRDAAINQVEEHARALFMLTAGHTIQELARHRARFVIDDVWAARPEWPWTHDKRAMGAAMLQAKRDKIIAPTDDFQSTGQVQRHAAPVRVWQSLIYPALVVVGGKP